MGLSTYRSSDVVGREGREGEGEEEEEEEEGLTDFTRLLFMTKDASVKEGGRNMMA